MRVYSQTLYVRRKYREEMTFYLICVKRQKIVLYVYHVCQKKSLFNGGKKSRNFVPLTCVSNNFRGSILSTRPSLSEGKRQKKIRHVQFQSNMWSTKHEYFRSLLLFIDKINKIQMLNLHHANTGVYLRYSD